MRRTLPAVLALAALFSLSCSRLELGWRAAPWLLEREGAQWLGLRGDERARFGDAARAWLLRGGRTVAPELARLAGALAVHVEGGEDEAALQRAFGELPALWDRLLEPALDPLAAQLASASAERAEALQAVFEERNARDLKRWEGGRLAADRERRLRKALVDWVGPLTPAQDGPLRAWGQVAFPVDLWRQDRLRRQQDLLAALRAHEGAAGLRRRLQRWWLRPEDDRDPAYARALERYRQDGRDAGPLLLQSLSPAQREYLSQRLRALAEDLAKIAERSAEKAP